MQRKPAQAPQADPSRRPDASFQRLHRRPSDARHRRPRRHRPHENRPRHLQKQRNGQRRGPVGSASADRLTPRPRPVLYSQTTTTPPPAQKTHTPPHTPPRTPHISTPSKVVSPSGRSQTIPPPAYALPSRCSDQKSPDTAAPCSISRR